jgi:ribosomal protein S18 acetylase RimI-like enzyme
MVGASPLSFLRSSTWVTEKTEQSTGFAEQWNVEDVQIITLEGRSAGWVQAEMASEIFLQQLFVSREYQGGGIGSKVSQTLLKHCERTGKSVVLIVLKNNPARHLYKSHGFTVVGKLAST